MLEPGEVHCVGELANAAALKLVANRMLAIVSTAAAELMAAGTRHGLDPEQVFWILGRAAPGLKLREAGFVRDVHEPAMFATRDMVKDLDLALALYQSSGEAGSMVPLTSLTRDLFARVASEAPDLDLSAIVKACSTNGRHERQNRPARRRSPGILNPQTNREEIGDGPGTEASTTLDHLAFLIDLNDYEGERRRLEGLGVDLVQAGLGREDVALLLGYKVGCSFL